MISKKTLFLLIAAIILLSKPVFGQNNEPLVFDLYEIQVFEGLTINGDHVLKMDHNGMLLKKDILESMKDSRSEYVNFHKIVSEFSDAELKKFRKNYNKLLTFLNDFDFKSYKAPTEKVDTIFKDGKMIYREKLHSNHDLGTRILIIDKDLKAYFINYLFCDDRLENLIHLINNLIPEKLKNEFSFNRRCEEKTTR